MTVLIQCPTCKATCLVRAYSPRPNEWTVREDETLEDGCEHMRETNDFLVLEVRE